METATKIRKLGNVVSRKLEIVYENRTITCDHYWVDKTSKYDDYIHRQCAKCYKWESLYD